MSVVMALGAAALLSGCGAGSGAAPTTVLVTETAAPVAASTSATVTVEGAAVDGGAVEGGATELPTSSGPGSTDSTSGGSGIAATPDQVPSASLTGAPFTKIDPLGLDCAVIMTGTELTAEFGGGLQRGTNRSVEGANPDRGITGRLKCQYGVSDDKSVVGVQIVFAQFQSAEKALTQLNTTVSSEKGQGAAASTTAVQGYLAHVLLRDGGLLVLNYDTWNMSVVVNDGLLTDAQLPTALAALADYALSHAVG